MKIAIASLAVLTAACLGIPALTSANIAEGSQETLRSAQSDVDELYALVKQARSELLSMREAAGLHAHPAGPHIDPSGHHEGESAADRERESREGDGHEDGEGRESREGGERGHDEGGEGGERGHDEGGEGRERGHGEGGEGRERGHDESGEGRERGHGEGGERAGGEESGNKIPRLQKHDKTYKNGAHLVLQYNAVTQAFVGSVKNTTKKPLSQVRVEIHLSNGKELGPTKRVDLKAGATIPVELSALGQEFTSWVTHPEAGVEEGHGSGGEESAGHAGEERGEHSRREGSERGRGEASEGRDARPGAANLRPVYNQLQLLRGEMRAFAADIKAKNKR